MARPRTRQETDSGGYVEQLWHQMYAAEEDLKRVRKERRAQRRKARWQDRAHRLRSHVGRFEGASGGATVGIALPPVAVAIWLITASIAHVNQKAAYTAAAGTSVVVGLALAVLLGGLAVAIKSPAASWFAFAGSGFAAWGAVLFAVKDPDLPVSSAGVFVAVLAAAVVGGCIMVARALGRDARAADDRIQARGESAIEQALATKSVAPSSNQPPSVP